MSKDESPPIEDAVARGYAYAEEHRDDRRSLGRIARARSAPDVTANVDPAEIGVGRGGPVAFWSGFAHGVRRYLVDEAYDVLHAAEMPGEGDSFEGSTKPLET